MIRVQAPDGSTVEFPEGTPEDTITRVMRQSFGGPTAERGALGTAANIAGQFGAGFNERFAQTLGALPDLYNRGLRAIGAPAMPEGAYTRGIQGGINAVVGEPPAPQTTAERFAHGAGSGLMDAATIAVPAARIASATAPAAGAAPGLLNRSATALAAQPAMQAAAGMAGGAVGEATDNPLLGAAAAFATPMLAAGASRFVSPIQTYQSPQRAGLVAAADREGIPLTAGQATGSRFLRNVESQLEQLPLTARSQTAIREGQEAAFTRAVLSRAGENADNVSPEVLNTARNRIGGRIGEIANRNVLRFTPQLDAELAQIEDSLRFIPAEAAAPVRARIEQLRGMVIQPPTPPPGSVGVPGEIPTGTIPGASYRMMDSQLGRSMRSTQNGDLRAALGDLRERLRTAMDASISPADSADWSEARRQYANLMTIARAAGRAGEGAAEGRLSPLALREAVNQSTGGGYAFGRGDLNELARLGQSVLRPPPDSGTAGRTMANQLLTGSLMTTGGIGGTVVGGPVGGVAGAAASLALPRVVQALMNNPAGQAYLRNQLVQQPGMSNPLAAALLAQQGTGYAVSAPQ